VQKMKKKDGILRYFEVMIFGQILTAGPKF